MELRDWIVGDLESLRMRLANGVVGIIPPERLTERVDGGGIAPVYVLWHAARHQDVAVNGVLRGTAPVLDLWADRVGIDADTWRGLAEAEDQDLVQTLDPEAVAGYALDVIDHTAAWAADADLAVLDTTEDVLQVTRVSGTAPPGRVLQVWAHGDDQPAISVGLFGDGETARLPLPPELRNVEGTFTMGISEEPPGGSLLDGPSGQVLGNGEIRGL